MISSSGYITGVSDIVPILKGKILTVFAVLRLRVLFDGEETRETS